MKNRPLVGVADIVIKNGKVLLKQHIVMDVNDLSHETANDFSTGVNRKFWIPTSCT